MCPMTIEQAKEKREKELKKQLNKTNVISPIPGLVITHKPQKQKKKELAGNSSTATVNAVTASSSVNLNTDQNPIPKQKSKSQQHQQQQPQQEEDIDEVENVTDGVNNVQLDPHQELSKKIKKLRRKIREIEIIEERIQSGELLKPDKDQLDKITRRPHILHDIQELERIRSKK